MRELFIPKIRRLDLTGQDPEALVDLVIRVFGRDTEASKRVLAQLKKLTAPTPSGSSEGPINTGGRF